MTTLTKTQREALLTLPLRVLNVAEVLKEFPEVAEQLQAFQNSAAKVVVVLNEVLEGSVRDQAAKWGIVFPEEKSNE